MASITFDKSTGWWSIRFFAGPRQGRVKKTLCKHPGEWSRARPPRRPPPVVLELAVPFEDQERRARIGIESIGRDVPLAAHVEAYCKRVELTLRPRTATNVRIACRKFAAYCEDRGVRTVQGVTRIVCREWIESRMTGGARRSTVTTERSNLMPIWSQAIQDRIVAENPWVTAKIPGKERREIPTAWTASEVTRLIDAADGWLRDLILLGLNTGIRIGALLALRWRQVDWEAGMIRVRAADSKSGKPYEVPMTPTAHDVLMRRQVMEKASIGGLIFPNPETGRPYASRTTFERIRVLVVRTGISNHGDFNHIMRRTFATIALNSGVPMEIVQRCLGHSTLAQTERAYAHLMTDRIKQGMAGFDLGGITSPPESRASGPGTPSAPATSPPGRNA